MDPTSVHPLLEKLHRELENAKSLDENSRELLLQVKQDIQQALQGAAPADAEQRQRLSQTLRESAREFEATHPTLVAAAEQVVDALGRMGL